MGQALGLDQDVVHFAFRGRTVVRTANPSPPDAAVTSPLRSGQLGHRDGRGLRRFH